MSRYYFIANPHARNGRSARKLEALQSELNRRGLRHELVVCESFDHASALSRRANHAGYDVVVGVGGDGTINRVLNGFYDSNGERISQARLGVVHIGTSPDFCRSHGVPVELGAAVDALEAEKSRPVSVGRVVWENRPGEDPARSSARSAVFGCCANVGLGASLARLANGGIRKYAGDFLGTFIALMRVLATFRPRTLQLESDGSRRVLSGVYNMAVGKTTHIASGLKVEHALREQDDRCYVLSVLNLSPANIFPVLRLLYGGHRVASHPCVVQEYARSIKFGPIGESAEVEFDGDPAGWCPCRIETAPDPLDLIIGEAA